MRRSRHTRWLVGLPCMALGLLPISVALGWVPVAATSLHAPMWILALCGGIFLIAGIMIVLGNPSRANDLLAGVICLLFGIVGAWIALLGPAEGFSGGLPVLSAAANTTLGRWVFGIGALMCFAIGAYAFRLAFQSSRYSA